MPRPFLGNTSFDQNPFDTEEDIIASPDRICYDPSGMSDVTQFLNAIEGGDPRAAEELLPLVYTELRQLAAARMAREAPGHTLQATALVHEAWLRLVEDSRQEWNGRAHFFGAAAEAMRRILIERARRRRTHKRGGGLERVREKFGTP